MFVDTHTHLYHHRFDDDREAMVRRAIDSGVKRLYLPNIDESSIDGMHEMVRDWPGVCFPMMGLHPCSVTADSNALPQWKDIELMFDTGIVSVLDASDNSEIAVITPTVDGSSADWEKITTTLPAGALDQSIIIEWRFQSDEFGNLPGWYLDDVEVTVP